MASEKTESNCPHCRDQALVTQAIKSHGVEIDCCGKCKGVWLDGGELDQVFTLAVKELQPPRKSRPSIRKCPKCDSRLRVFKYPQTNAEVDMCPDCLGLWLDRQEYTDIKAVREKLEREEKLEMHAPVEGAKGQLIRWINGAIDKLSSLD